MEADKPCAEVVELGDDDDDRENDVSTTGSEVQNTQPPPPPPPLTIQDTNEVCGGGEKVEMTITDNDEVTVVPTVHQTQDKFLFRDEMKFMKDFDPNQRTIKKKMKKFTEDGVIVEACDCLIPTCLGCHFFKCKNCGSHCCGHACRLARTWDYEEVEIQGVPGLTVATRKRKISQF